MKLNRKLITIVLIIIVLALYRPLFVKPIIETDEAVANITAVNFRIYFQSLDMLKNELIEEDRYNQLNRDEIIQILRTTSDNCFDLQRSFDSINILNNNYYISILPLVSYLDTLIEKIETTGDISNDDIQYLNMIVELKEKYGSIRLESIYKVDTNPFTELKIPEELKNFLQSMEIILSEVE